MHRLLLAAEVSQTTIADTSLSPAFESSTGAANRFDFRRKQLFVFQLTTSTNFTIANVLGY
jgi:hypothetical protein